MNKLNLLDISLNTFDEGGGGAVAAGSNDAGSSQQQEVVYGKEVDNESGDTNTPEDKKELNVGENKASDSKDSRTKFEEMINGEYKDVFNEIFTEKNQSIFNQRFKDHKNMETQLKEYSPIIDAMLEKFNVTNSKELAEYINSDEFLEDIAYKNSMDIDTYKKLKEKDEKLKQYEEKEKVETEAQRKERVDDWYKQSEALKADFADFDLKIASQDSNFLRVLTETSSVEKAFKVAYPEKVIEAEVKKRTDALTKDIQAKGSRPKENSAGSKTPGTQIRKSDVNSLTKEDRKRIAEQAKLGKKISF